MAGRPSSVCAYAQRHSHCHNDDHCRDHNDNKRSDPSSKRCFSDASIITRRLHRTNNCTMQRKVRILLRS